MILLKKSLGRRRFHVSLHIISTSASEATVGSLSSSSICKGTVATSGVIDTTPTPSSKSTATSVIAATSATRFRDRPSDRRFRNGPLSQSFVRPPREKKFKPENHVRLGQDMVNWSSHDSSEFLFLLMDIETIRNRWIVRHILEAKDWSHHA